MSRAVTLTLDDATYAAAVAALCANYSYPAQVPDPASPGKTIPNLQTPDQFATYQIQRFVGDNIRAHQVGRAAESARQQASAAVEQAIARADVKASVE